MSEKFLFIFTLLSLIVLTITSGLLLINTYFGDPTIYLVYARNIASGDFLSFNPGQFSSGSTSPLWASLLSFAFIFDFENGPFIAKIFSFFTSSAAIFISFKVFYQISKNKVGSIDGAFSIAYFLILPGNMIYESSITILLILGSIYLFHLIQIAKEVLTFRYYLLLILLSLIPLSRPDAFIILFIFLFELTFNLIFIQIEKKYLFIFL